MFYEKSIEKIYIINGLARSGNHLFISWLISSFNDNEVYYLNNIKINQDGIVGNKNLNIDKILKYHTVCNDNKYGDKLDVEIKKKLVKQSQMIDFLKNKENKDNKDNKNSSIKILIFSMENKHINKIDMISNIFINAKQIYKCIVIRDILNLFSSRLESEKQMTFKKYDEGYYNTDKITIEYWLNNFKYTKNNKYITFNYNKFNCYESNRIALAKKLNIDYEKTKITLNKYGITKGSSFETQIIDKKDYYMRWLVNKNNHLIKYLLNNNEIMNILCKDFATCINKKKKTMKICKETLSYV